MRIHNGASLRARIEVLESKLGIVLSIPTAADGGTTTTKRTRPTGSDF